MNPNDQFGINLSFSATRSGLTRWEDLKENWFDEFDLVDSNPSKEK